MTQLLYRIQTDVSQSEMVQLCAHNFSLVAESAENNNLALYDSFDWRLFHQSLALVSNGRGVHLAPLTAVTQTTPALSGQTAPLPTFAWDLPEGSLRDQLASVLAERALLPKGEFDASSAWFRLLDENEKTVIWMKWEQIRPSDTANTPTSPLYIHLLPVRGYDEELAPVADWLESQGGTAVAPADPYYQALAAVGQEPGDYTAKPRLTLDPGMPAAAAMKRLLLAELDIIRANESYISQDIDTEFLHDFRVALRRTRAALSQFKFTFPADITARFKMDLKMAAQITNELRDLDVYLLAEPSYRALLPDMMQADIGPLFAYLQQKRAAALATAVSRLQSPEYQKTMADWEAFLQSPAGPLPAATATRPILPLAQQNIYRRYRRILKDGRRLLRNAPDTELHALRIECKKLRYLLEFFASLFPPQELGLLTQQLKTLQANLGDINDLLVQEAYLLRVARELPVVEEEGRRTLLAVGALIATFYEQRTQAKALFGEIFTEFAAPQNRQLFKQLFKVM